MKALVAVKQVIDAYAKIRVKSDHSGVETDNIKMAINPFDEIAIEEAVRQKEKGIIQEIIAVSIGKAGSQDVLRTALALGADRAILVEAEQRFEPINIAKILKVIVEREEPKIVLLGKQSIDGDNNQTGQMLAALLGWSQGTFVSALEILSDKAKVTREIDGGLETLFVKLPTVITTDLRLNQPRYATLPNIMKAKQKSLSVVPLTELALSLQQHIKIEKVTPPSERQAGMTVNSVAELVQKLKEEGVI
ncbi:MAG: electron transfer flavoprotein subunit beta/FixA family protein [Proteobacteria bacterium]|nr:electron transfer flavoprotein subunit beta/FixA family protein [Pseudomonadota bacterium]